MVVHSLPVSKYTRFLAGLQVLPREHARKASTETTSRSGVHFYAVGPVSEKQWLCMYVCVCEREMSAPLLF